HPAIFLLISWLGYYFISRTGSYFFAGTRHSLLLLPLIAWCVGIGVTYLNRRLPHVGSLVFALLMLCAFIVPREYQEDMRSATDYWLTNNQSMEPTYVYYGASRGLGYRLEVLGITACANRQTRGTIFNCQAYKDLNLTFGKWLRGADDERRIADMLGRWPDEVDTMWLIFSHIHSNESQQYLTALSPAYEVVEEQLYQNAEVYKVRKVDAP
ncbi:MAG: hypothetical protein ACPG8W_22220, partial [Candidatus Promineifilaceae bacterium]